MTRQPTPPREPDGRCQAPSVVLFHHVLGLTPGVRAFATRLRARGHTVITPDLFSGRRFSTIDAGVEHAMDVGFDTIGRRAQAALGGFDGPIVVVGMSMGVMAAKSVIEQGSDVSAAVFLHSAFPSEFLGPTWPATLPVQIHIGDGDPFAEEDLPAAIDLVAAIGAELVIHETDGHLAADASTPDYDEAVTRRTVDEIDRFIRTERNR